MTFDHPILINSMSTVFQKYFALHRQPHQREVFHPLSYQRKIKIDKNKYGDNL